MLNGEGSARQKISRLFDSVIDSTKQGGLAGGCLLCDASLEKAATDSKVQKEVRNTIRRLKLAVLEALKPDVESVDQAASLSAFIVSAYFGSRVLAKGGAPIAMIGDTRDKCLQLIP